MKEGHAETINKGKESLERKFTQIREEVKKIPHIDAGIVETVAALRAHGLNTDWSCSGHPEGYETEEGHIDVINSGTFAPDVRIAVPGVEEFWLAEDGLPDDDDLKSRNHNTRVYEKLGALALEYQFKLASFFEEFYKDRHVSYSAMIHIVPDTTYRFWIVNNGRETLEAFTKDDQQKAVRLFKKEFDAFTEFLKKKFFENKN